MTHISHSAGTEKPAFTVPANACDSHIHLYDAQFAPKGAHGVLAQAGATEYKMLQKRLGTTRTVIVNPRASQTDNRVTLVGIEQLGRAQTRGVGVVNTSVTDSELQTMHDGGICGIRFTLYNATNAPVTFDMVELLARRVHELGWHVQLHWTANQIVEHEDLIKRLPCSIVFDHLARLPLPAGIAHPAHRVVTDQLKQGKTWVKLSGAYLDSQLQGPGQYADLAPVARSFVATAPDRMVWGSDWPHPTETTKPNDADLLSLLTQWADSPEQIKKILVDNPAKLYGFD